MNRRRLYRCTHDQRLAGVAGGVAEYFDLDPTLVRILWVVSLPFTAFFSLLLYIVMALVVPPEPDYVPAPGPWQPGSERWSDPSVAAAAAQGEGGAAAQPGEGPTPSAADAAYTQSWHGAPYGYAPAHRGPRGRGTAAPFLGIVLILFGAVALIDQLLPAWDHGRVWPLFIVGLGVLLVGGAIWRRPSEQ